MVQNLKRHLVFSMVCLAIVAAMTVDYVASSPVIGSFDFLGVCIRNCAQCKKMYGPWFEGQLCADACLKFKGKIIPDCEDVGSIAPFLNKLE